jgi:prepilin-type N-terminal cleavage/methylation domain-containing protein
MKVKNSLKKEAGFSIVEVVIALFILGIVMLVYASASNTLVLNRIAKHQQLAYRIAASELESLRSGGYGSLPASGSFSDSLLSNLPSGVGSLAVSTYDPKTKQVVVTVTWTESSRPSQAVVLTTLVAEGGLGQ